MAEPIKFDAGRVASLASEIAALAKEVEGLRRDAELARSAAASAECRLSNLKSEFTRAVTSQLDESLVPRRQMHAVAG